MQKKDTQNYSNIILFVIFILATILRFSPIFWRRDFWYDEAFTGIITRMSWSEMWWMIFHDVHPPLYYYLLKPWAALFNYSAFGFRSFSVLFGLLSIWSIYYIGKKIFNEKVGLTGAFLMTISPFAVQYSQEARMYALFGFISLWLTYFFIKALRGNNWRYWIIWGILGVLFLYTHYLALFTFVIFYLVALGYQFMFAGTPPQLPFTKEGEKNAFKKRAEESVSLTKEKKGVALLTEKQRRNTNNSKDGFLFKDENGVLIPPFEKGGTGGIFGKRVQLLFINKKFIGAVAIIVVAFILWLPALKQHLSREGLGWVPVVYVSETPRTMQFFLYGHQPGKILEPIPNEFRNLNFTLSNEQPGNLFDGASLGLIFLLIIFFGILKLWRENKYRQEIFILTGLSFGVLLFLTLLSQIGWRFYVARYFMATAVLIYLLLAVVIAHFNKWWRWAILGFYVLTLFWLKPIPYDHSWTDVLRDNELVNNETIVIADNAFEYATARFHFGEGRVKLYNRGEPDQDLSAWIIVEPEDQITTLDNYINQQNVIYVGAGDCHWNQYQLQPAKKIGRLQVCG